MSIKILTAKIFDNKVTTHPVFWPGLCMQTSNQYDYTPLILIAADLLK